MKKGNNWALALPLVGLIVIGAGCAKDNVYVNKVDDTSVVAAVKGDAGEAKNVEEDIGMALPADAAVTLRLSNDSYSSATYTTKKTVDELVAFYDAETANAGFSPSHDWTEFAAGGFSATSNLFNSGTKILNVSISEAEGGSSVALTLDDK